MFDPLAWILPETAAGMPASLPSVPASAKFPIAEKSTYLFHYSIIKRKIQEAGRNLFYYFSIFVKMSQLPAPKRHSSGNIMKILQNN